LQSKDVTPREMVYCPHSRFFTIGQRFFPEEVTGHENEKLSWYCLWD
jgi:hypothetical protein